MAGAVGDLAYDVRAIPSHRLLRSTSSDSRTRLGLVFVALTVFALASCLTSHALAAEGTGKITGEVTSATTKAPIAGIEVCALPKGGGEGSIPGGESGEEGIEGFQCPTTDASGDYTISGLASGEYIVAFGSPFLSELNYITQFYKGKSIMSEAQPVTVAAGGEASGIDAALAEGGRIAGKVTDASTGSAIKGALVCAVEANPEIGGCAQTNSSGEYTIAALPGGEYKVEFAGLEYVSQYYNGKSALSEATAVAVAVGSTTSGIDAALAPKPPAPPADVTPPTVIVGTAMGAPIGAVGPGGAPATPAVGGTLLCAKGVWTGTPRPTFTYRWLRDGAPIAGATESSYVVQAADAGHTLACEVTAKNASEEKSATSAGVAIPGGGSGRGSSKSTGSSGHVTIVSRKLVVSRRPGLVRVEIHCSDAPCRGSVELTMRVVGRRREGGVLLVRTRTLLLAKGIFSLAEGRDATVTLDLTAAGRRWLAHAKRHPRVVKLAVIAATGAQAASKTVRVS